MLIHNLGFDFYLVTKNRQSYTFSAIKKMVKPNTYYEIAEFMNKLKTVMLANDFNFDVSFIGSYLKMENKTIYTLSDEVTAVELDALLFEAAEDIGFDWNNLESVLIVYDRLDETDKLPVEIFIDGGGRVINETKS